MAFFRKEKEKVEETLNKNNREPAKDNGFILKYYGGHPLYSKESKLNILVDENEITAKNIFGVSLFTVYLKDIIKVNIEKEEEVIRRYTATRIALFGPFALAMKKKKVNKKEYLVIECKDFILTFESNMQLCKYIYLKINEQKHKSIKQKEDKIKHIDQSDNLDQIKKLKELLDICAISQEEFEIKKKELLGI